MDFSLRPATLADLPAINAIYNHYVLHSTCTYQTEPSSDAQRAQWFEQHRVGLPVLIACDATGEAVGWAALSRFHPREAYRFTLEDSVYVRQDCHRRGIGKALLTELLMRADSIECRSVIGVISADQEPSIALHRSLGFREAGRLRNVGYKFHQWLDAVYLQWESPHRAY